MNSPMAESRLRSTLLIVFATPLLGVLMGGVYWLAAVKLSGGREPWLGLLLLLGIAVTVFGGGSALQIPLLNLGLPFVVASVSLLVIRRIYGDLARNLEHFGIVHVFAVVLVLGAHAYTVLSAHRPHPQAREIEPVGAPN
jgi:hypothetical protein